MLQLVKKMHTLYETRRFITVFTTAHHFSLSPPTRIQSAPSHLISSRSNLILSSHLRLVFAVVPSSLSSPLERRMSFYSPPNVPVPHCPCLTSLPTSYTHMFSSAPIFEHLLPLFFSNATDQVSHPYESSQNCNYVYFNVYMLT